MSAAPINPKDKAIADLSAALNEATTKLEEQDALLKEMAELPGLLAKVTAILPPSPDGERVILDRRFMVIKPKSVPKLKAGDMVHMAKGTLGSMSIIGVVEVPPSPATVMKVEDIIGGRVYVDQGAGNLLPIQTCTIPCEIGDRLLLGGEGPMDAIAMENLGKDNQRFQFNTELEVTWDDIGGQDEAKLAMKEAIEYPVTYAKLFKSMGKRPIKGVLLEGPPGCGKTLLAKAATSSIHKLHGKDSAKSGYIYVKGPEILSKWVGGAESTIRSLFQMAREHKRKHNYPAIVFIDECEAILSKRGTGVSSDMEKTIVPSFLAELDGLDDSGALVILATNRGERLDPAVIRDGRIDRRVRVSRPNLKDSVVIFDIHLRKVPSCRTSSLDMASHSAQTLFSSEQCLLYRIATTEQPTPLNMTLGHITSGAMIAGIVDRATSIALHNAISAKSNTAKIDIEHLESAILQVRKGAHQGDHADDIAAFVEQNGGGRVKEIEKVVYAN